MFQVYFRAENRTGPELIRIATKTEGPPLPDREAKRMKSPVFEVKERCGMG
jgi:hypothetical protein